MSDQFNYQAGQAQQTTKQEGYQQGAYQQAPQYPQQNYQYQNPNYQQNYQAPYQNDEHMTVGNWIVTYLLLMIPIANIVLLFVWAFSADTKKSKKTWAQASLLMMAITIALAILISIIIAVAGVSMFNQISRYY